MTESKPKSETHSAKPSTTVPAAISKSGPAKALVEAFAFQLEELKAGLKPGEVILLGFTDASQSRALHKIDLKAQGDDIIFVSITWVEGDEEKRVFTCQSFQPILAKEIDEGGLPEEARTMVQQVLGHLTAHGVLYTQMLARDAELSGDAKAFLDGEHKRALEVVRTANISAAGMDADAIRNKALAVVDQTFESIQVSSDPQTRIIN